VKSLQHVHAGEPSRDMPENNNADKAEK